MGLGAMTGINMGVSYITTKNGTTRSIGSYISEVPALARGAVIPANREFLALLGDQSHGNNIEAPESLIRRIVREETAGLGGGKSNQYQFTAQLNGRTIFDAVIKEAKLRQTLNNKNPFELA